VRADVLHCVRGIEQTGRVIEADVEVGLSLTTLHKGGPLAGPHVDATHAALGEILLSYIAPGDDHGALQYDSFYTEEVNGEKLVDWVTRLIEGEPVDDVHCKKCTAA
jgi:hypothetical protein